MKTKTVHQITVAEYPEQNRTFQTWLGAKRHKNRLERKGYKTEYKEVAVTA